MQNQLSNLNTYTDQMGRQITLPEFPKKIISLVPSQTELLYDLGLEEQIAGITKFCIHPEKLFRDKPRIGGTKQFNFEKIKALNPDLIIGNKEENEEKQIKELMQLYPVWMSDIKNLEDSLEMINQVGIITNKTVASNLIIDKITTEFNQLKQKTSNLRLKRAAYFIWRKPYMVAGNDTFIDHLLEICRFENIFKNKQGRYPEISETELKKEKPEVILLSSEPYPFKEKHIRELQHLLPNSEINLVDGEMFSWYGSRLKYAPGYFKTLVESIK